MTKEELERVFNDLHSAYKFCDLNSRVNLFEFFNKAYELGLKESTGIGPALCDRVWSQWEHELLLCAPKDHKK